MVDRRATPPSAGASSLLPAAIELHGAGRLAEAERIYTTILESDPAHPEALAMLGAIHLARGRPANALELLDASLAGAPHQPVAHSNRGLALMALARSEEALGAFDSALALAPAFVDAHRNRGNALHALARSAEALHSYDRAVALAPRDARLASNRAVILWSLGRHDEALESADRAVALAPDWAEAHNNRGIALYALGRMEEALASYDRAIALAPQHPGAHNNRALALVALARFAEALAACDQALAAQPSYAEAVYSRGIVLKELGRHGEALECFDQVAALGAKIPYLDGARHFGRMQLCEWGDFEARCDFIRRGIESGARVIHPFAFLTVPSSAALQRRCAEIYVADRFPAAKDRWAVAAHAHHRIRLGYFSADFHEHATAFLIAELFERHDRSRFEALAFSFGPPSAGPMRKRIEACLEFLDVRHRSDEEIARLARDRELDIAIDLKGFTQDSRPGIFARRVAPIQLSYLGFPGTMGADYMDYIVADSIVIPRDLESGYAERVVRLPHSYQANDSRRRAASEPASRGAAGLPPEGFVFCCFNSTFKITPDAFAIWMRLLHRVPGSILWLLASESAAMQNLRREARDRGIDGERLVFAPPLDNARHLARLRLADLVLDTFHCGAHTTASDALWAGVPVVTCPLETFASRVAASLLHAVGLPELVARSPAEYEEIACDLANQPSRLRAMSARLTADRAALPLFDSERFTRDLESVYEAIASRKR